MKRYLAITIIALALASCKAPKNVTYMDDAELMTKAELAAINPLIEPTYKPGDLLNIDVTASTYEAVEVFNKGRYINYEGVIKRDGQDNTKYYLVDINGDIDFPLIGKIHVGGLSRTEVVETIATAIYPKYIKEMPTVDVRLMNFSVTVIGAVNNVGVVTSDNERMTIFEALAKCSDLNLRGERESVKILRTFADGSREVAVLDLHDKNILTSPYYNLQQNDLIYVIPNQAMRQSAWQMSPVVSAVSTVVGSISGIIALIITIVNL